MHIYTQSKLNIFISHQVRLGLLVNLLSLSFCCFVQSSYAQSNPITSVDNRCSVSGGLGEACTIDGGECQEYSIANHCVIEDGSPLGQCYVSCEGSGIDGDPSKCSFGEQCISGPDGYYCQPVPFQMDLNLLDQCIVYWLEGGQPAWSNNQCSLEANLNRLLDQNQDYQFDIFDLDLCVLAFLDRPDPPSSLFCNEDTDCGLGLYCDPETQGCTRECGLIPSREESISDLDRQCVGALKVCNYERGRCESLPLEVVENLTCEIDRNCPSGSYCFLGQCSPYCYRGIDCPSSDWYCTDTNKCRVLPELSDDQASFNFDPASYAVRFGRKRLDLDGVRTKDSSPLAIMDLITRQQVISNPSVSFGYRLLVDYALKEDARCLAPFPENCETGRNNEVDSTAEDCYARIDDCIVDPQTESWIRLNSPFGVVSASGDPQLEIELEEEIADRLSPGKYRATIKAVYDNGDSDELNVYYTKKSPSGQYNGYYSVHYEHENYSLSGNTPINLALKIYLSEDTTNWDSLLRSQSITPNIRDIADGIKVYAYLDGRESLSFANATPNSSDHNVPFLGVYYPDRGLLRLIGKSLISYDYIDSESTSASDGIEVKNLFGRNISRQVELFGPFDATTGSFYGVYSEQITGLRSTSITLRGKFSLQQILADSTPLSGIPFNLNGVVSNSTSNSSQSSDSDSTSIDSQSSDSSSTSTGSTLMDELDTEINLYCNGNEKDEFTTLTNFQSYLNNARQYCDPSATTQRTCVNPIFSNLVTFSDLVGEALGSLGSNTQANYLTVYDYLRDRVQLCPEDQTCTADNNCEAGYRCNTARGMCVRSSSINEFYVLGKQCGINQQCSESNMYCDQLNSICLPKGNTCSSANSCLANQRCLTEETPNKCIQDLDNFACTTLNSADINAIRGTGTATLPAEILSFMSRVNITFDELESMMPTANVTVAHKLCVNLDVPSEFQAYSNYEGGDSALCVSENNARCGLALYQKALIKQTEPTADNATSAPWVDTTGFSSDISSIFAATISQSCASNSDCPADFECPNVTEGQTSICRRRADATLPLFCDAAIDISGCEIDLDQNNLVSTIEKTNFVLKEHNRFWLHLVQALKFQGDAHLSDAFMTLYRNQENPFTEGAATVYKREQQVKALKNYNKVISLVTTPIMDRIFMEWPIDAYLQRGNDWLSIMQTIASDRMETLAAMVDLDRRIFLKRNLSTKFNILQNILQQEYLFQVYLLHLQISWQSTPGFLVNYEGRSEELFREGQQIINQVNVNRNELGLFDNQVYFETSRTRDSAVLNWQHYRNILTGDDGDGGLLGAAKENVAEAVEEMKASLSDLDALEEKLFEARREISGYIAEQCGASAAELRATMNDNTLTDQNADGKIDYCDYLLNRYTDDELVKNIRDCKTGHNTDACNALGTSLGYSITDSFKYNCDNKVPNLFSLVTSNYGTAGHECLSVVSTFANATNQIIDPVTSPDPLTAPPRCDLNRFGDYAVNLGGRTRMCVGGRMGSLVQQKRLLEFQREQVIGSVETLMKRFTQNHGMGIELGRLCLEPETLNLIPTELCFSPRSHIYANGRIIAALKLVFETVVDIIENGKEVTLKIGDGVKCSVIGGLAVGTDCPQSVMSTAIGTASISIGGILKAVATGLISVAELAQETDVDLAGARSEQAAIRHEIAEMGREVDGLITEFQTQSMEIFNTNLEIDDLRYQIAANYATYQDDVRFIVDHLTGRQSGNLLRGRRLAKESDETFREVLQYAYRMFMAFTHYYNLSQSERSGLKSRLINSATLDDIERFIDEVNQYDLEYCGREGIDCDTTDNIELLKFSVRQRLFPNLRDIVDARTGRVITAGEQFHNMITSPPYYKQTVINQRPVELIELLFSIPLTMQEYGPNGANWLINPLECNHLLSNSEDPSEPHAGNVAINVMGQNLDEDLRPLRAELIRGGTDFIRACRPEVVTEEVGLPPVSQYTIRPFTVGYAPQSSQAQGSTPASYSTRSGLLKACVNADQISGTLLQGAECWRFFGRGRSLSANGYQLRIPIKIDEANTDSAWIMGHNLPASDRPLIEDIVIYFRYHSRPTSEN